MADTDTSSGTSAEVDATTLLLNSSGNVDRVKATDGTVYLIESTLSVKAAEEAVDAAGNANAATLQAATAADDANAAANAATQAAEDARGATDSGLIFTVKEYEGRKCLFQLIG